MYSQQYKTGKIAAKSSDTPVSNQFTPRHFVVQPQTEEQNQRTNLQTHSSTTKTSSHRLPNISICSPNPQPSSPPRVQMKLSIGKPGDKYEQEADKLAADIVQRIHAPETHQVQRLEVTEGESELQTKPIVQRLSDADSMSATPDLETSIQRSKSGGQPLAQTIKEPMEQAFGADFSSVKIHTDAQSDQMNHSIQAKAFTTGQDIFFRQGAYQPGTKGGQELIAHELTHVVQQNGNKIQPKHAQDEENQVQPETSGQISHVASNKIQRAVGLEIEIPVPVDNLAAEDVQDIQDGVKEYQAIKDAESIALQEMTEQQNKMDAQQNNTEDRNVLEKFWDKQKYKNWQKKHEKAAKKWMKSGQQAIQKRGEVAQIIQEKGHAKYGTSAEYGDFRLDIDHDDRVKNSSEWPPREGGGDSLLEIVMDPPATTEDEFNDALDNINTLIGRIDTGTNGLTKRTSVTGFNLIQGIGPLTYDEDTSYAKRERHNYQGSVQVNLGIDLRQYKKLIDWYAQDDVSKAPDSSTDKEKEMYNQIRVDMALAVEIARDITAKFMAGSQPKTQNETGNFKGVEGWVTHMALYMQRGAAKDLRGTIKNVVPVLLKTPNEIAIHYGMTDKEKEIFNRFKKDMTDDILKAIGRDADIDKELDEILIFPEKVKEGQKGSEYTMEDLTDLDSTNVMLAGKPINKPTGVGKRRKGNTAVSDLPSVKKGNIGGGLGTRGGMVVEFRNIPGLHDGVESWRTLGLKFFEKAEELNSKPGI